MKHFDALSGGGRLRAVTSQLARADAAVNARVPRPVQSALASGLLAVSLLLGASGALAATVVGDHGPALIADRRPDGRFAADEALGAPIPGTEAPVQSPRRAKPAPAAAPAPAAPVPALRGALPVGKGMWIYIPEQVEGGDVQALVNRAKAVGITHVYVRTGSSRTGFYAQDYLNRLLPVAHANGIRVFGWDFPYLVDWQADVARALAAIHYRTPDGHRIDGFSADIETRAQGVNVAPDTARAYGGRLRYMLGAGYPLIATVPRPSPQLITYPFAEVVESFDAIAPMIYWLNREPGADTAATLQALKVFNKPLLPIGQAYDGSAEGGRPGVPPAPELARFMQVSEDLGATAVSFWSWQHADQQAWDAIRDAPQFRLPVAPTPPTVGQVRAYQVLLNSLGFPVPVDGVWGPATAAAIAAYQTAARLPASGAVDQATLTAFLTPFAPPINQPV
jgi:hypothetical protein